MKKDKELITTFRFLSFCIVTGENSYNTLYSVRFRINIFEENRAGNELNTKCCAHIQLY